MKPVGNIHQTPELHPGKVCPTVYEIDFDDMVIPVNAYCIGQGLDILFLHGWAHSGRIWEKVMAGGIGGYRALAVDLPGFGQTPPFPDQSISLDSYVRFIRAFIQKVALSKDKSVFVGDSMGGLIALRLLEQGPQQGAAILSGTPVDGLPRLLRLFKTKGLLSFSINCLNKLPRRLSARLIQSLSSATLAASKDFDKVLVECALQMDPRTGEALYRELCLRTSLPTIPRSASARWKILRGSSDRIVSRKTSANLARHLNADYLELNRSGHTPMIENPEGYRTAIVNLVDSIG